MKTKHVKSMLKKQLWIWMSVFLSVLLISNSCISYAAPVAESGFDTSDNGDGTVTISYYRGTAKDVIIPETIGGKTVTKIGDYAFGHNRLTSVVIPNSVTAIGNKAFLDNQLTSVEIGDSVTSIGIDAFRTNLLMSVTIGDGVKSIGEWAFLDNQLTNVKIGDSVTYIGEGAFQVNKLTSVEIPNSVIFIGNYAFYSNKLTSVKIGGSVTTIGDNAFTGNQLTIVEIPNSVTDIGHGAFNNNKLTSVKIGDSVTTIGGVAFADNQLTSVEIPNSVTTIGGGAFADNQLTSVEIPNSVTKIDIQAFRDNQLKSAVIQNGVIIIGDYAFSGNMLKSVEIPNSVTTLGSGVFRDNQLTSVTIGDSVSEIGNSAFENNQLTNVKIPNSTMAMGTSVFRNNHLTSVEISNSVTELKSSAFENNHLTSVEIPNSVTLIGFDVFRYNDLTSVEIPNSVTAIWNSAFADNRLTSVKISNSMTKIFPRTFENNQLTSVEIPNSVTEIDVSAFANNHLTSVEIPEGVSRIRGSAFINNHLNKVTFIGTSGIIEEIFNNFSYQTRGSTHLVGWFTDEEFTTPWNGYTLKTNTIYGKYEAIKPTYTVTYDGNGNTRGNVPVSSSHEEGTTATVAGNSGALMKVGHTFNGWNTKADGSGDSYTAGTTFTMGKVNLTLYAQWAAKPTYTVTYDGNENTGGSVPVSSSYEGEAVFPIADNTGALVKAGYSFMGWNKQADGSGYTYKPGTSFTMGEGNLTLYAKWTTKPIYTITYDGNENTGGIAPVSSYNEEGAFDIIAGQGTLVKAGHTFNNWNTKADGSGDPYSLGTFFRVTKANLTLYAQWTTNPTYKVTYDGNENTGGSVPVSSSYEEGATATVAGNTGTLAKVGNTFNGWNTKADGTGTAYSAGATFPMAKANLTLYAQWTTKPTYEVMYDGNENTGGSAPVSSSYEEGALATVAGNTGTLVKVGNTFTGWNTKADGTGVSYSAGATFPMAKANLTLYAQWTTKPTYEVTYDGNGNTGGSAPVSSSYEEGALATVAGNTGILVKAGNTFNGWNTKADGTGTAYSVGATFPMAKANLTLYAQWTTKPTYAVVYDGNENTGGSVPVSSSYEEGALATVAGNTGTLAKVGNTFNGWNTKADGSGTAYSAGATFSMGTANLTLYAQWTTKPTYAVMYDGNENTGGSVPVSSSYEEGALATVAGNTGILAKAGNTFNGWNMKADGTGTAYSAGATFPMAKANLTLYAQWSVIPITPPIDPGPGPVEPPVSPGPGPVEPPVSPGPGPVEPPVSPGPGPVEPPVSPGPGPVEPPVSPEPGPVEPPVSPGPGPVEPPVSPGSGSVEPIVTLPAIKFKDISSNWAREMIEYLMDRGFFTGYPDGTFRPNEPITRQHVALMLTRGLKFEGNKEVTEFTDVPTNHPYYEVIRQVQQAGLFVGDNGNFNPNANMTRAQIAKVIVLAFGLTSTDKQTFKDVPSTHWAHNYIAILAANGIALGDNGDFKPEEPVTRAQFAAFLYRVLNK